MAFLLSGVSFQLAILHGRFDGKQDAYPTI